MKTILLIFLIPVLSFGTSYSVNSNTSWHTATGFTPNGIPDFGDTIANSQYVLTCESGQTCNVGTVNTTSLAIGDGAHAASLVINGTLVLRGEGTLNGPAADCGKSPAVVVGTGGALDLDENGGASASGFVIPSGTLPCTRFTFGTPGDNCDWTAGSIVCPTNVTSINNSSANGILLLDSGTGYGDSITNWNGVAISHCGSSSTTVGCYQSEIYRAQSSWTWKQLYLNGNGAFGSNPLTGLNSNLTPVTIDTTISVNRLAGTDIYFEAVCVNGSYSPSFVPACAAPRSVTNSLVRHLAYDGAHGDAFTAGATVKNVYWDGLGSYNTSLTSANIAGGSWSYVVAAADAATCSENVATNTSILAPKADHVYSICTATAGIPIMIVVPSNANWHTGIDLSNFIFDNETTAFTYNGHCLVPGGSPYGNYPFNVSYVTILKNPALGYGGCQLSGWTGTCPYVSPAFSITHVLQPGNPINGTFYVCEGNTNVSVVPVVSVFKSNIFYDSVPRVNPLWFGNSNSSAQPANVVPPTGVDYNVNYNYLPFITTPYTTACASGCTNSGSAYAVPMTGSAPGPHDQNIPPGLFDNTRTAYTWAASRGQPATPAGFRQVFVDGGPSAIGANISALFYYINQGNVPAKSLWNAMPDGTTIGPSQPVMFPRDIRTVTQ